MKREDFVSLEEQRDYMKLKTELNKRYKGGEITKGMFGNIAKNIKENRKPFYLGNGKFFVLKLSSIIPCCCPCINKEKSRGQLN